MTTLLTATPEVATELARFMAYRLRHAPSPQRPINFRALVRMNMAWLRRKLGGRSLARLTLACAWLLAMAAAGAACTIVQSEPQALQHAAAKCIDVIYLGTPYPCTVEIGQDV